MTFFKLRFSYFASSALNSAGVLRFEGNQFGIFVWQSSSPNSLSCAMCLVICFEAGERYGVSKDRVTARNRKGRFESPDFQRIRICDNACNVYYPTRGVGWWSYHIAPRFSRSIASAVIWIPPRLSNASSIPSVQKELLQRPGLYGHGSMVVWNREKLRRVKTQLVTRLPLEGGAFQEL